jgi:hypothetical protein
MPGLIPHTDSKDLSDEESEDGEEVYSFIQAETMSQEEVYNTYIEECNAAGGGNSQAVLMDTGSTCHITYLQDGMCNLRNSNSRINVGTSNYSMAKKEGDLTDKVEKNNTLKMTGTQYIPCFKKHICSTPLLLNNGNKVEVYSDKTS